MKILGLDISSHTGYALIEYKNNKNTLLVTGTIHIQQYCNIDANSSDYPWNFINAAKKLGILIRDLVLESNPDKIIIEETNKGRNRIFQKLLEYLHYAILNELDIIPWIRLKIEYLNTSEWRKLINLRLSKEQKKNNAKVSKAKKLGKSKKEFGVKGRITPKHLSVRYSNNTYNLKLKQCENDLADAICLCDAYINKLKLQNSLI